MQAHYRKQRERKVFNPYLGPVCWMFSGGSETGPESFSSPPFSVQISITVKSGKGLESGKKQGEIGSYDCFPAVLARDSRWAYTKTQKLITSKISYHSFAFTTSSCTAAAQMHTQA
jgi:hypothetical protein